MRTGPKRAVLTTLPVPLVVAVAAAAVLALHELTSDRDVADATYLAVIVWAGVAACAGAVRAPRGRRLLPWLIAAGVCLNAVGETVWEVLDRLGADTDVSVADLAWYGGYAALAAALIVVLRRSRRGGHLDLDFVVDAVTIVAISVLVFWTLSVQEILSDDSVPLLVRLDWAGYPVVDAVLLGLVVRALASRRARAEVDGWFGVGVCLWLAADVLYLVVPEDPAAVHVMDACWMLAPLLLAGAAWRAGRVPSGSDAPATESTWLAQLFIAVGPLLVPPALDVIGDLRGRPGHPAQLVIGTSVVVVLAFVRTGRLLRSEQRAQCELVAARDAAVAASEAKSMFVATMSHEIRTPLTTILGTAELLRGTDLDEHQARLLDMLRRSGGNLRRLVEDLLDFSRLTAGQGAVERGEFDLPALVAELVETHAPRAQRSGVALVAEVGRDLPRLVEGDRRRVLQVLTVLVDNALKFTHEGRVVVSAAPDRPGVVRLAVADTGIGIAPEDQGCVFDSFVQVDGSATRRYEGTGLGLAIGKELTELMGGTLTLQSELGVGSTFTVLLPLPGVREPAAASAQAGRASSASTREARSLGENGLVM